MSYDELMRDLSRAVAEQRAARAEATRRHDGEQAAVAAELRPAPNAAAAARRRRGAPARPRGRGRSLRRGTERVGAPVAAAARPAPPPAGPADGGAAPA